MFGFNIEQEPTGNNFVSVNNVALETGPCTITTGNGNDEVTEHNVSAFVLSITTNRGNDAVTVANCSANMPTSMAAGTRATLW